MLRRGTVDDVGRARPMLPHAHVERPVMTEGKAPLRLVQLHGGNADVEHHAIDKLVHRLVERRVATDRHAQADVRLRCQGLAESRESLAGRGAQAVIEGKKVAVGGPRMLADAGLPQLDETQAWATDGMTVLHVIAGGKVVGAIGLEDEIRPESAEAIASLHALGLKVAMITGDAQAVADSVAKRLGIDEVAAQVLPADKANAVRRFQQGSRKVAMVGDGVNDAPALATADVGIAIGAGTDVAVESAGIVLVRSDPRDVVGAIELSRASYRKMVQNLVWASGYNVIAIPVAAGILVPWGLDLPMALGAVAMSVSTIIVAANAQLLRRLRLRREPVTNVHQSVAAAA